MPLMTVLLILQFLNIHLKNFRDSTKTVEIDTATQLVSGEKIN